MTKDMGSDSEASNEADLTSLQWSQKVTRLGGRGCHESSAAQEVSEGRSQKEICPGPPGWVAQTICLAYRSLRQPFSRGRLQALKMSWSVLRDQIANMQPQKGCREQSNERLDPKLVCSKCSPTETSNCALPARQHERQGQEGTIAQAQRNQYWRRAG